MFPFNKEILSVFIYNYNKC